MDHFSDAPNQRSRNERTSKTGRRNDRSEGEPKSSPGLHLAKAAGTPPTPCPQTLLRVKAHNYLHRVDLMSSQAFWPIKHGLPAVYPALKRDVACEVAVIGGGITGALVGDAHPDEDLFRFDRQAIARAIGDPPGAPNRTRGDACATRPRRHRSGLVGRQSRRGGDGLISGGSFRDGSHSRDAAIAQRHRTIHDGLGTVSARLHFAKEPHVDRDPSLHGADLRVRFAKSAPHLRSGHARRNAFFSASSHASGKNQRASANERQRQPPPVGRACGGGTIHFFPLRTGAPAWVGEISLQSLSKVGEFISSEGGITRRVERVEWGLTDRKDH